MKYEFDLDEEMPLFTFMDDVTYLENHIDDSPYWIFQQNMLLYDIFSGCKNNYEVEEMLKARQVVGFDGGGLLQTEAGAFCVTFFTEGAGRNFVNLLNDYCHRKHQMLKHALEF